jgi:hypothetical protein
MILGFGFLACLVVSTALFALMAGPQIYHNWRRGREVKRLEKLLEKELTDPEEVPYFERNE